MSAICGMLGKCVNGGGSEQDFDSMLAAREARGSDGLARHVDTLEQIGLGFRFLRTSPDESSPNILINEDRSLMLVCDGHVFNEKELRPQLRAKGHSFGHSHSCELLLHLYEDE